MLAAIGAVVFMVWAAAYFVTFWSTTGQTPGARMMRFRVLALDAGHGRIRPRRACLRLIAMVLVRCRCSRATSWCCSTIVGVGLHDRIAGTVVVDAPETETPAGRPQPVCAVPAQGGRAGAAREPGDGIRRGRWAVAVLVLWGPTPAFRQLAWILLFAACLRSA